MLLKYFFVVLITLHVIYAEDNGDGELSTSLKSTGKDDLKNRQRDLESTILEKFKKLEKNVINALEEYLDVKLEILQKNIYRKIEALEENVPIKTDIYEIERDLGALKNGSISCGSITIRIFAEINEKLSKVQTDISKLEETITSVTCIRENLNHTKVELRRVVEEFIKPELDALNQKIPENFEESTNLKLDAVEKQIVEFNKNVSGEFESLENTLTQKLDEIQNVFPFLEQNINNTLEALRNSSSGQHVTPAPAVGDYVCKSRIAHGYDFVPVRLESLEHSTVEFDYNGYISNFETRFAVKGSNLYTHFWLATTDHPSSSQHLYLIDFFDNERTLVRSVYLDNDSYSGVNLNETLYTGNGIGLSPNAWTAINLKINGGLLTLRPEDSSRTLIHYNDHRLKKVKYIGFTSWVHHTASFHYDCPAGFAVDRRDSAYTLEVLRKSSSGQEEQPVCPAPTDYSHCKSRLANDNDFVPIRIKSLDHSTVEFDSNGYISNFETRFAVKGRNLHVWLLTTDSPSEQLYTINFVDSKHTRVRAVYPDKDNHFGDNLNKTLYTGTGIELSPNTWTAINLKINRGVLELKLECSSQIFVHFNDNRLKEVKYIGFTPWVHHTASLYYDCPAGFATGFVETSSSADT